MLTTSIIFLVVAAFSALTAWNQFTAYAAYCQLGYTSPAVQVLVNPGFAWIVAAAILTVLSVLLLVRTLLTKKNEREGKKLPFFVAEISAIVFGAAVVVSNFYFNIVGGHCYDMFGVSIDNYVGLSANTSYVLSVWPIVLGGLLALLGLALLVIQILKGVSAPFATKVQNGRIYGFFRDYKSEMKKIVWSPKKDVARNTLTVVVTLVIVSVLIGLFDLGFTQLLLLISKIGG